MIVESIYGTSERVEGMYTYVLVEDEHVGSSLVESVCGAEAGETATDDDDARHGEIYAVAEKGNWGLNEVYCSVGR